MPRGGGERKTKKETKAKKNNQLLGNTAGPYIGISPQLQGSPNPADFLSVGPGILGQNTVVANNPFDDPFMHQQGQNSQLSPFSPNSGVGPGMHPPDFMINKQMHQQVQQHLHHGMPVNSMPSGNPMMMSGNPQNVGKMFPPNQPLVFNPANPNAPPIYPCGVCQKEIHDNDQAILCESGCNFWFHRNCTGLTEPAYTMLTQEVYAEWVCDKCLHTKNIPLIKMKP